MYSSQLSRKRVGFILFGLMLSVLIAALDSTIGGTAMPKVISDLQGMEHYAWPFTAYMQMYGFPGMASSKTCQRILASFSGRFSHTLAR